MDQSTTIDPIPLWNFRLTSLGVQVVLWASLGLAFGIGVPRARLGARTG
jgi:hypothetical protein